MQVCSVYRVYESRAGSTSSQQMRSTSKGTHNKAEQALGRERWRMGATERAEVASDESKKMGNVTRNWN